MKEQEAIEELKCYRAQSGTSYPEEIEMAIAALEEIRQYRAIGTVEKVKEYKEIADNIDAVDMAALCIALGKLKKYQSIGSVEQCQEAVEKQKEMEITDIHVDEYYCPACGAENGCDQKIVKDRYCPQCGQALKVQKENTD